MTRSREIMRELVFERTIERGPYDPRQGEVLSNEEMGRCIRTPQK